MCQSSYIEVSETSATEQRGYFCSCSMRFSAQAPACSSLTTHRGVQIVKHNGANQKGTIPMRRASSVSIQICITKYTVPGQTRNWALSNGSFLPLTLERRPKEPQQRQNDSGFLFHECHVVVAPEQLARLVQVLVEELSPRGGITAPFIFSTMFPIPLSGACSAITLTLAT